LRTPRAAPVYFFVGDVSDREFSRYQSLEVDRDHAVFLTGRLAWILQTYLVLREHRAGVFLSRVLQPDGINVVHAEKLIEPRDAACFTVGVLADKAEWTTSPDLTIVQNREQADASRNRHWLPHWPQPGLVARDAARAEVRVAAYCGSFSNLGLAPHLFAEMCRKIGLEGHVYGRHRCADLSGIDILVGVRSLDTLTHDHKPASKLVNAWLANIPFIGGYDSAFAAVGAPGRDYLRVSSRTELEEALLRLKNDPALYARLVEAGQQRRASCDRTAVTRAWLDFLDNTAHPALAEWRRQPCGALI
jgi:hypothetical protein